MTMTIILEIIALICGPGFLITIGSYIFKRIKENDLKTQAICLGVQALLRDRLLETYNHYTEKGYAPIYAKENFENMWRQYHALGVNGVMDDKHEKFMSLPDKEVKR